MHGLTWSELNYQYVVWFILSVSSLPLSVMVRSCHACVPWVVFIPRLPLRRRYALAVALHRCDSRLRHIEIVHETTRGSTFSLHEIFKCAHLNITVYVRKQTYTQHPVTLVWGSLRLAQTSFYPWVCSCYTYPVGKVSSDYMLSYENVIMCN